MPQTSRTVKSEHLLKKMLYCPFAFPHILKMVFVSNFYASPTAIQIILTIHLDSLLCRKGQNILHIEQKDFSMEEFSIKCAAVVAYKTITSSLKACFAFLISCFLFKLFNFKFSSRSNINLISKFLNVDIFWANLQQFSSRARFSKSFFQDIFFQ